MTKLFGKTRLFILCVALSVLTHFLAVYAVRIFATYDFTTPISRSPIVAVDLANPAAAPPPPESSEEQENDDAGHAENDIPPSDSITKHTDAPSEQRKPDAKPADIVKEAEKMDSQLRKPEPATAPSSDKSHQPVAAPLLSVSALSSTKNEKLTYQISMWGLPVGSAELEAKNEKGEIWLTLRVKSNTVISSFYPVDDLVETRHIGGDFIISKIKQQEGSFKGDTRFTIFLREKSVFWINRITNRSQKEAIPTDEALDTLSGIYFLRNKQLQVGKTETLHIYDSESYADVPVEILRKETVRLPNLTKIDTLVVQPLQKSAGIFKRTGDILIWMTDDENKVPVKIVTSVALGTVTVELVSAEATTTPAPTKEAVKKK